MGTRGDYLRFSSVNWGRALYPLLLPLISEVDARACLRREPDLLNPVAHHTMSSELKPLIEALIAKRDLSRHEAETGVRAIISGVDPCQTSAFLVLLRAKGETPSEVRSAPRHCIVASFFSPCRHFLTVALLPLSPPGCRHGDSNA